MALAQRVHARINDILWPQEALGTGTLEAMYMIYGYVDPLGTLLAFVV